MTARSALALVASCCAVPAVFAAGDPAAWVPARWSGGPLEVARRAQDKALAEDAALRQAIARWYEPATLKLLEGTPVNCLLLTLGAEAGQDLAARQYQIVKEYAGAAHERGHAVLGIVYPGADASAVAAAAAEARLEGLVLQGEFPAGAGFIPKLQAALRARKSPALVIPIAASASAVRTEEAALLAVEGAQPNVRNLSDMGIRAGASAEPWIESNIWLVRSFRLGPAWRPIWVSHEPAAGAEQDYTRAVADAAVAGGRWIVAIADGLRAPLLRGEAAALDTWRAAAGYLRFAEDHAEWRRFTPYGNLAIILDTAAAVPEVPDEYLNLVARRQVPYRLLTRSELSPRALAGYQAVLAADLAPPTAGERKILLDFAERGGLVVMGPSWGGAPKDEPYVEIPAGKGRVAVYKEDPPDPESVAREMLELLAPQVMGLNVFNLPSGITYVSSADSGRRVLVGLLNYAATPANRVTIRMHGAFSGAHLYTPENAPLSLAARSTRNGATEVLIPRLSGWGAVLFE